MQSTLFPPPQSPSHQQEQPPPQIPADYLTPHARFSSFYNSQPAPRSQAQFGLDYEMVEREDLGDRNPLCRRSGICSSTHARKLSGDWRSLGNQLSLRTYTTARTSAVQDHQEGRVSALCSILFSFSLIPYRLFHGNFVLDSAVPTKLLDMCDAE
jgi:hypothetical protein